MQATMRYLSLLLFIVALFTTCRKYEEGPNVSFRKKEARVTNNWRVESAVVNGVEESQEPFWTKQKHYMYRDGKYIVTIIDPVTLEAENYQGTWELYDEGRKLSLMTKNPVTLLETRNEYNILKLFEKSLWIRKTDNSLELHFTPSE
jgi:hypothetical protein